MAAEALLAVEDLRLRAGSQDLVRGVSFEIAPGEAVGLVGASGCGKSMTTLALLGLLPEGVELVGGAIRFGGEGLEGMSERAWRKIRGARIVDKIRNRRDAILDLHFL